MLRRLVVNTGSNYAFRAFTMVLGLVKIYVLVEAIGAEGYGLIVLAGSVMGYFTLLRVGVPAGTVKYVAEYEARGEHETVNKIIGSSLMFFVGVGAVAATGVALFTAMGGVDLFNVTPANRAAAENVLYLAGGLALVSWPGGVFGNALDGLQRYPESKFCKGVGQLLNQGAAIAAAWAGQSIEVVFLCNNLGMVVGMALQAAALRWRLPTWRLHPSHFDIGVLQMIFGYSVWMLLKQLGGTLLYQTDRVLLALFLPVSSVAVYEVVTRPFLFIRQMNTLFRAAVTPAVSASEAEQGRAGLDKFIYTMCKYANAAITPLAVVGALLSGPFVEIWMGPEYAPYAWIAQVTCIFQMVWYHTSGLNNVFYGTGKVRRITLIALFAAVANVPLGIWWVQEVGVAGVVLSTVAAGFISLALMYALVFPELDIGRWRYVREAFVGGQWTSWVLGLLCLPLWGYLQGLDSWVGLFGHAAGLAACFYGAVWVFVVESRHQQRAYRYLASLRAGASKESA